MPKIVDHDQYRKELLRKCFNLFAERGYAAITMRQIAQALGVSTGTLYHYFPSKEALFEQMVEDLNEVGFQKFAIEVEKATTLEDRLDIAFDYLIQNEADFIKESLIWIEFIQQRGRETLESSDILRRLYLRTQKELSRLLGIQDAQLTIFLMSLIDGLMFARLYVGQEISLSDQLKLLKTVLMTYLKDHPQELPINVCAPLR